MSQVKKSLVSLFSEHQTIASILTIIVSFIAINSWMTADMRGDMRDIRNDIQQTNKRIDALFQYVLVGKSLDKKE